MRTQRIIPGLLALLPLVSAAEHWSTLLRRNLDGMLQAAQGIRTEAEVDQLDMVQWSTDATKRCIDAIDNTASISNRAGVIVCYNIPLLVVSSGVFSADFRLIQAADSIDDWAEVDGDYSLRITYGQKGAAVNMRDLSSLESEATAKAMRGSPYRMLQNIQFLGQIEPRMLAGRPDDTKLQALLTPNITVAATTKSGQQLLAQVSIEDSKFLTGVFSDGPTLTDEQTEQVQNAAFELPGTKLEIVPAGLYFFGAYMALACAIFGWGTMDRAKYRDQYRRRLATHGPGFK